MQNFLTALILTLVYLSPLYGNSPIILRDRLEWDQTPQLLTIGNTTSELWRFRGAVTSDEYPTLPFYIARFPLDGNSRLTVELVNARLETFDRTPSPDDDQLAEQILFQTVVEKDRNRYYGEVVFTPIVRKGNRYERLVEFELRITATPEPVVSLRGPTNTRTSVLSSGNIFKVAVSQTGIHRLSYNFLKNDLKIDIDNINPKNIQLFGNGGGMIPALPAADRIDDLEENHIWIAGGDDGRFDPSDYILFFAEGADRWSFDPSKGQFNMEKNIYAEKNYYFIRIDTEEGLRVTPQSSLASTAFTSTAFDDYARLEQDKVNLLHEWARAQGSGQNWYGDHFRIVREYSYDNIFVFPNLISSEPATIRAEMMLRATDRSAFTLEANGQRLTSSLANRVAILSGDRDNEIAYANPATLESNLNLSGPEIDIRVNYPYPSGSGDGSEGWLDYVQINVRRQLIFTGDQMAFRDSRTLAYPSASFQLSGASDNTVIWDISNPLHPRIQEAALSGSTLRFGVSTEYLKQFIAFNPVGNFPLPEAVGKIDNQNIHGLDAIDMVILYHPDFLSAAQQLADHRRKHSRLEVAMVRIDQLYNEFSSGRQDPAAIRDFARMLYQRTPRFRYLLLFGDGSFDFRNIYQLGANFIPVYQRESLNPILTFPSDDYFGLLENTSTTDALAGDLQIDVGRLPVKTPEEAEAVVNKIIHYDSAPVVLGDWRNRIVFVGDDEDNMLHTRDANLIADDIGKKFPFFNIDKIYLDAFPQESTPGGSRFPAATDAINQSIFKGVLVMTYLGHGGSKGWAQERVLNISDILSWQNFDRQPLVVTATCSFTGYDDAAFTTAGEEVLLNERGGAIALYTTVRAVYAQQNAELTERALEALFEREDGHVLTIGEAMRKAKNSFSGTGIVINSRKFALIGDPALRLGIPEYQIATTRINDREVGSGPADTLRALQKVTIEGVIQDLSGQVLSDFNGILFPTIFDKKLQISTLGQDRTSYPYNFTLQKNIIFKGRATVNNGAFRFTFVVPRDINYQLGPGKISYYAADETSMVDAAGSFEQFTIGGTNPNAQADNTGPKVEVYLNTEDFVFGGITGEDPTLLVKLEDDNGINVVGNSIGHDLEAILDDNTQNTILLNDFYESELDDYRLGVVRYPLENLEEGRHQIRVKAWDVANNSSEGYTEFIVAPSGEIALEHVLNYPNPFTDLTCFQFDHNLANQEIEVLVQIYTISGRLVKTIEQSLFSDGALRQDDCIPWDGRDDYGDRLARGVYLYKVRVRALNTGDITLKGESEFEKLVLLK